MYYITYDSRKVHPLKNNNKKIKHYSIISLITQIDLRNNLLTSSTRLASGAGKTSGDAVHQQHHGWSILA